MKAIILSAGVSRRLYPLTLETPKCLLVVGDRPILSHQVDALLACGVTTIHLVVGYYREKIAQHLAESYPATEFTFHINQRFFETNTAFSLQKCLTGTVPEEVILMNGDVLYPPELLRRTLDSEREDVLAVDTKSCAEEEVKVIVGDGRRIVAIGKRLAPERCHGEFIGVAKFSTDFTARLTGSLDRLIAAGGKEDYFEAAIEPLLAECELYCEDVSDLPCIEIDFLEDYENAQALVKGAEFDRTEN
jgi:choline kinase